jgi:hypothetical protein
MAVICTEISALRYSTSTVLPDHKHEAVNFEYLVWYRPNIIIPPCVVSDWLKYQYGCLFTPEFCLWILSSLIFLSNLSGWMSHRWNPGENRWTTRDGMREW